MTLTLTSFDLIKILREKVGEEQAVALSTFVETKVKEEFESKKEGFATKADVSEIKNEITTVKTDIANVKIDIANLKTSIVEASRNQIIWTVATMVTLFGISIGLILHFMK